MLNRRHIALAVILPTVALRVWAGESGLNVVVVVNQNSSNSLQLANEYCERRHVPPQNVFRMTNWTGGADYWAQSDFETNLLNPLLDMISTRGLANQAQIVLLSMDIPYGVTSGDSVNGTTSALFYGFKTNTPVSGLPVTCSLPPDSTNSYSYSELPFALAEPDTATNGAFLAVMLTDTSLARAQSTLERGVLSDSTFPPETVYLEKTSDIARNVRFVLFDNAIQECRARGDDALTRISSESTDFTNALGLDTGLFSFTLPANAFVPGAIADDLDSFCGELFENTGQPPLLVFLEGGANGSYGTVVEPCNYPYKFPDPMVYFYQNRGFCFAEAYYQSLANPYEGVIVGEPLSAPFARPGSAVWNSPANASVVSGLAGFNVSCSAADTNHPLAQADLFVDGTFAGTITNLPPSPGNILSVTIDGVTASYTNASGDTLGSAATGMASAVAALPGSVNVQADAVGDRLVLRSQNVPVLGSHISVQAGSTVGSASATTSFATAAMPTFLDSTAYGYHLVEAANSPNVGDWLGVTFIETNGLEVTVAATNTTSGATISSLLQALMNQINNNQTLQAAGGANAGDLEQQTAESYGFLIYANAPGWPASQIQTIFTGSTNLDPMPTGTNALDDNSLDLQPRAHVYLSSGAATLPAEFALDTTAFADGFHELTVVFYEGTSVGTQTWARETVQFRNTTLSAAFSAVGADTNGNLEFSIAANATNIERTELFSTGGLIGTAIQEAVAEMTAPTATLGVGLHPFYAIVTDANGHQFQTQTLWEQVPALQLSILGQPQMLSWPAITGRQYTVLASTNLNSPFQSVASVIATNAQAQCPIPAQTAGEMFYCVSVTP
jgi:uncharacterized protein (TIGR03790 family)